MNDVKAAFKAAFLSIPEGSTCYWLVKRRGQYGRMEKINEIAANEKTDIYEEILLNHGAGEYLVWLMDNNDKKVVDMPTRFKIPGEQNFDEEEEDDDEEEDPAEMIRKVKRGYAKKLQDDLELEEILSIRERLHGKKENVSTNQNNNDFIQAIEKIERRNEERERRLEEKINNMQQNQQQAGIFTLIAEMQKSNSNMTQLMMQQQSENQKIAMERDAKSQDLIIALLKKDDGGKKDFWDSPFFLEVYKKATEKPKSIFDDSMAKMMDMFFQTQQQTVQRMLDIQLEAGQNDMFFQRMKVFKDMAAQVGPGIKDFALRWASIKAAKETEQEKIRAKNITEQPRQQPQTQRQNTQQEAQPQQQPSPTKPKVVVVKQQRPPEAESQTDPQEEELKRFFLAIYHKIVDNDNIEDIEREIREKPGAVKAIKEDERLQAFVDDEGGRIKELFDKIRNEVPGNE